MIMLDRSLSPPLHTPADNTNSMENLTTDSKPMWMRTKRDNKIVMCDTCQGTGLTRYVNDNPYYDGPHVIPCYACRGMGRVRRVVVSEHFVLKQEELAKYTC
jgi:DnaJ-class molecular chaperone